MGSTGEYSVTTGGEEGGIDRPLVGSTAGPPRWGSGVRQITGAASYFSGAAAATAAAAAAGGGKSGAAVPAGVSSSGPACHSSQPLSTPSPTKTKDIDSIMVVIAV